jgi:hypothetical protein
MQTVWLVDASTYRQFLKPALVLSKQRYFRIKHLVRTGRIGPHPNPGTKTFSMGLLRIANLLAATGANVRYVEAGQFETLWRSVSDAEKPSVVGFTAVTPTISSCARLAEAVKSERPSTRVILGGPHALIASGLTSRRYPIFDIVTPATDLAAVEALLGETPSVGRMSGSYVDYRDLPRPLDEYGINVISRTGCPFTCLYCQDRLVDARPADIASELEPLRHGLRPGTMIHFCDSVLGGGRAGALRICTYLEQAQYPHRFSCDIRAELIDRDLLKALMRGGFYELRIGLDATDEDVLTGQSRSAKAKYVFETLRLIRSQSDLYVSVYLVTGLPGSRPRSHALNLRAVSFLLGEGLVDEIKHHLYVPYPGDDPDVSPPDVCIRDDDWDHYDRQSFPVYELSEFPRQALWESFLEMEEHINDTWSRAFGIDTAKEQSVAAYPEYNLELYAPAGAVAPAD